MTRRLNFITGIAMLVLATTLAFMISRRPAPVAERNDALAIGGTQTSRDRNAFPPGAGRSWNTELPGQDGTPSRPNSNRPRSSAGPSISPLAGDFTIRVDPDHPRHQELLPAAVRVERHARDRLDAITRALELTPIQQQRIFPALVRSSDSYHPAMSIVTGDHAADAPVAALTAEESQALIQRELEPGQQDRMIEHSIADLMLWEEIIGNLILQLDQSAVGEPFAEPRTEEVISPAPPPSSRGGRNLFESAPPAD